MEYNSDFQFDLRFGNKGETEFAKIVHSKDVEVKKDRKAAKTGNFYIEYESRGKESGISTTKADYWVLIVENRFMIVVETDILKKTLKYLLKKRLAMGKVKGGDSDSSLGVLVSIENLTKGMRDVHEMVL
jgi:hypothetical protein